MNKVILIVSVMILSAASVTTTIMYINSHVENDAILVIDALPKVTMTTEFIESDDGPRIEYMIYDDREYFIETIQEDIIVFQVEVNGEIVDDERIVLAGNTLTVNYGKPIKSVIVYGAYPIGGPGERPPHFMAITLIHRVLTK